MDEACGSGGRGPVEQASKAGVRPARRVGKLSVLLSIGPIITIVGLLLFEQVLYIRMTNNTMFSVFGGFMIASSLSGIVGLLLAFRAIVQGGGAGFHLERLWGGIALGIFIMGLAFPVSLFPIGNELNGLMQPADYEREKEFPEERHLRALFDELTGAARKDPEQYLARLSPVPGRLMHEFGDVYAEGHTELPSPYIARRDPKHRDLDFMREFKATVDDSSFFYLGYELTSEAQLEAFADAYRRTIAAGEGFDKDLRVSPGKGKDGGDILPRLGLKPPPLPEGVRRPPLPEVRGRNVPVLIERIANNRGRGAHVLFLDGHVEFISYPGRWPMTEHCVALLEELDHLGDGPQGKPEGRK